MPFATLPLAVTLAALAPGSVGAGNVGASTTVHVAAEASTYDEATCAALRGELDGLDGWDRAAIGELTPANEENCSDVPVQSARTTVCELAQLWGEHIESCYVPRMNLNRPALRPLRAEDTRHLPRLLLGQLVDNGDAQPPLPQPERRAPLWALVSASEGVPAPLSVEIMPSFLDPHRLSSVTYRPAVPPPRR